MIGRTISHYRIVSQLGSGGMGVVYGAEDIRLGREVAVKFVSEDYAHDAGALERLRSEARAASALNHANICTIYDVGEDNGHPFIVMELMKGQTLRDRLESGPLKVQQLVDMGIEIADALHSTHSDGIIHRDIKPGNIFLTDRGHVKILDFGLAKLSPHFSRSKTTGQTLQSTMAGVTLGTISYMSPEQAEGEVLDGRSDLFSLGVVLYECATGQHPFPAKTSAATLAAILHKVPVAPIVLNNDLPLRLQEVINNLLEKDRELRCQSAAELRADLKRLRRDLESGHGRSGPITASIPGSRSAQSSAASDDTIFIPPATHTSTQASASDARPRTVATGARPGTSWIAVALTTAAVLALASYALWRLDAPRPSDTASVVAPSDTAAIQSRLDLARASLSARNYRAAAAYAAEVLALNAGHAEAASIRDASRAMLERFDVAMTSARQHMAAGDFQGASQALETARAIDATAPGVVELSSRLADELRRRDARAQAAPLPLPPRRTPREPETPAPLAPSATVTQNTPPVAPSVPPTLVQPPTPPPFTPAPTAPTTVPPPSVAAPSAPAPTVAVPPDSPVKRPAPATPPATERRETEVPPPPTAAADQDDAAIRRLTTTYAHAIESKDLALFRSIKPNLSRDEERRLQDGFRAVTSQRVNVTVLSIDRRGDDATVVLRRRDTIQAGGRQQSAESQQTLRLTRAAGGWVIVDIR
jgi:serine/threonine protein kinase